MTCILLPGIAHAQAAPVAGGTPQAAETNDQGIGEIIVTANKREENLNKTGVTASVVSGAALAIQRINSVADLSLITPGLTFAPAPNTAPVYSLRGVGFYESTLAAPPDVSLYMDQVPLTFPIMSSFVAFDLERVETLKGPQGTLFGNNATGGAINFIAAKPTDHLVAGGDISYGRFNTVEFDGHVSGPLTDTLGVRVAMRTAHGDPWQESYTRDDKLGRVNNIAGRVIVDWKPSSDVSVSLNVNGWINKNDPQAPQNIAGAQTLPPGSVGPGGSVGILPVAVYPIAPHDPRAADWSPDNRPFADVKFWQTTLRADIRILDAVTLTSLSGYSHISFNSATEGDGTALHGLDIFSDQAHLRAINQELRLANDATNRLRWVVGANLEDTRTYQISNINYSDSSSALVNGIWQSAYDSRQKSRTYAGFGNLEYDLTDQLKLKGGVRHTRARRSADSATFDDPRFANPGPFTADELLNIFFGVLYPGQVPTIPPHGSVVLDNRTNPDGSPVNPATYLKGGRFDQTLHEHNTSWSVGLDYKPTSTLLLYGNVSKGYKAGSFPLVSGSVYGSYTAAKQESVLDYEVGFKAQLADHRINVNGAAFYYDYKNKQLRGKFVDPIFGSNDTLINVPKSRIKGAEIEVVTRPTSQLTVSASATYLDAKVKEYTGPIAAAVGANGLFVPVLASFEGRRLPFSPKLSYAARADYDFPIKDNLDGVMGVGISGQTSSISTISALAALLPQYKLNARTLVNFNVGVKADDNRWNMSFWMKNAFNKYYGTNTVLAYDNIIRYVGPPRTFGVSVGFNF